MEYRTNFTNHAKDFGTIQEAIQKKTERTTPEDFRTFLEGFLWKRGMLEEHRTEIWYSAKMGNLPGQEQEEDFWEQRAERREKLQEQFEEIQRKKAYLGENFVPGVLEYQTILEGSA